MKANTRVLTAHVPIIMAEKLDQLTEQLDRARGWIIKQALTNWIAEQEERRQLTLEALADNASEKSIKRAQDDEPAELQLRLVISANTLSCKNLAILVAEIF